MIKFFRKIRRSLLSENKFSKYLLYAVGEIILVVIGILIALQINTWNTERIARNEEQTILNQLQSEFQTNLVQLNEKIALHERLIESGHRVLLAIDGTEEIKDQETLNSILSNTLPAPTFDPINGVTNDIINSGKLYLIQNDSLRQLISGWSGDINFAIEEQIIWRTHRDERYIPFLIEHYNVRSLINGLLSNSEMMKVMNFDKEVKAIDVMGNSKKEIDVQRFILDTELEDQLANMLVFNQMAKTQITGLKKKMLAVLDLIDKELDP